MCGIAGQYSINKKQIGGLHNRLEVMSNIISHRGPDGMGIWKNHDENIGFAHRRLSIIDLGDTSSQPMSSDNGITITYNGEIYNYIEIRAALEKDWYFKTRSDTECIIAAYSKYGIKCLTNFRGMFAFAIWDDIKQTLFCARDRFGIKPFYYTIVNNVFYFASEAKALLPFLPCLNTNKDAFAEYLTFQYTIGEKTLFEGIYQLLPGHALKISDGKIDIWRYWDVSYTIDYDHSAQYFENKLRELLYDSVCLHGRSDVPVGAYISGGVDSSLIFSLARRNESSSPLGFHGRFVEYPGYDESNYAESASMHAQGVIRTLDITANDFKDNVSNVIYHLDFPTAGPGAFPQYMVSKLAAENVKVVLGGQGGDEIFGGYARYLVAYFEQCIKAAIDGEYKNGNYVVTLESIVPNLGLLREYKPMLKQFWSDGLFGQMDSRYFRLIDRSVDMHGEVDWFALDKTKVFEDFKNIFNSSSNVRNEAYLDKMTHFDFKTLLPALLQVEDRVSMAHGLESRVPFLDHPLVEFVATIPADIKFSGGKMKELLKNVFSTKIPDSIKERRDKMGFPVPMKEWMEGELHSYFSDLLLNMADRKRPFMNSQVILDGLGTEQQFSRKSWALVSLELWYQNFHDRSAEWKKMISTN